MSLNFQHLHQFDSKCSFLVEGLDDTMDVPKTHKSMCTMLSELYRFIDPSNQVGVETRAMAYANRLMDYNSGDVTFNEMAFVTCVDTNVDSQATGSVPFRISNYVKDRVELNASKFRRLWKSSPENEVIRGILALDSSIYDFKNQMLAYLLMPVVLSFDKIENGTSQLLDIPTKGKCIKPGDYYKCWVHVCYLPKDANYMRVRSTLINLQFIAKSESVIGLNVTMDKYDLAYCEEIEMEIDDIQRCQVSGQDSQCDFDYPEIG